MRLLKYFLPEKDRLGNGKWQRGNYVYPYLRGKSNQSENSKDYCEGTVLGVCHTDHQMRGGGRGGAGNGDRDGQGEW